MNTDRGMAVDLVNPLKRNAVSLPPEDRVSKLRRLSSSSSSSESSDFTGSSDISPYPLSAEYRGINLINSDELLHDPVAALCTQCQAISLDDMLKEDARDMSSNEYFDRTGYLLHDNFRELGECAFRGCLLCRIILMETKQYLQHPETETYHELVKSLYDITSPVYDPIYIRLSKGSVGNSGTFEVHTTGPSPIIANLEIESENPENLPFKNIGRSCHYDLGSSLAMDFAREKLDECQQHHTACRQLTSNPPTLPTRVIDVGSPTQHPRLVLGYPRTGEWVSLSHCWGGVVDFTTTKATLEARFSGIYMDNLPGTFRDAIDVTRELGVQYLWIDAICIIQDSMDDDWPKEAARMREYYSNSMLTISATNAENSRKGILQSRTHRFKPLTLHLQSDRLVWKGEVSIREGHTKAHNLTETGPVSVLTTRGWVLQEQCLPPRTLHFTAAGLVWECLTHEAREWLYEPINYGGELKLLIRPTNHNSPDEILDLWDDLVKAYSMRKLTYPSDKLPAISGLAAHFGSFLPGVNYLAGIWESGLIDALCWNLTSFDNVPRYRPEEYLAPSWSWASVDGEVILSHTPSSTIPDATAYKVEVIEVHIDRDPHNLYGGVSGGRLRLRGLWIPVYLDVFPIWEGDETMVDEPGTFYFVLQEYSCNDNERNRNSGAVFTPAAWEDHIKTRWLDILHPSNYSSFQSREGSPTSELSYASVQESSSESYSGDEIYRDVRSYWEADPFIPTCIPLAKLDIPPTQDEFLDKSGRFLMGVLMLTEHTFLLIQPSRRVPGTFCRIGIANSHWVRNRRFSSEFIEQNTCEIVLT